MRKKRSGTGKTKNMYTRYRRKTSHSQTLTVNGNGNGNGIGDASATSGSTRSGMFYGCYLLASLSPRYKGHTYIGFTVNPKRRIRQHNGEISSGASTTKKKRPWEMVLCIHGFPTHVAALQFEWAWQHPTESLAVRQAAAAFKTLGGLANKIKLALTMLSLPSWHCMDLTVSFFSTKYMKHTAGCPTLPHHIKLHFCSMDELPCYSHPHHSPLQDQEDDLLSHSTQLFGTDDRQLSSLDGHFQMNCFQSGNEINTIQKENETWEHTGVPTLESSSVDDHMQLLLHQVPFDVAGNSTYELLQLDEQIWPEGFITPFPIPDKHHAEADPSSQLLYPVTKQHMQPLHLFPAAGSEESSLNEQLQHRKEVTRKEQRSWSNRQAESSPMDEYATVPEKFAKKSDMICVLIDDSTKEKSQPTDDQSHSRVANTIQMSSVEGIEVIDLLTPTPDCRIRGGSKKRRIACNSPDIIDLTRSPLFVQL